MPGMLPGPRYGGPGGAARFFHVRARNPPGVFIWQACHDSQIGVICP